MNEVAILNLEGGLFVEVTQYSSQSITMELRGAYIGIDQLVSLSGEILIRSERLPLEAVGKVVAAEVVLGTLVQFEFQLKQFQKNHWQRFLDSKQVAQDHVDNLLLRMKGLK